MLVNGAPVTLENAVIVHTTEVPWVAGHDPVLILFCSDPRYRLHVRDFIDRHLGLKQPVRLPKPGGAAQLLPGRPGRHAGCWEVEFHAHKHRIRRVIAIGHAECAFYDVEYPHATRSERLERQLCDFLRLRGEIRSLVPDATYEVYFAEPHDGRVVFRHVPLPHDVLL